MSTGSYLPPEIRDSIVDSLRDIPETLKQCCLVSKSLIPRTRKHLFSTVIIDQEHHLEVWKRTFPDIVESPAYNAHILFTGCPHAVTTGDAELGAWIRRFFCVVNLEVWTSLDSNDWDVSLVPFHNFSPVLKSLRAFTTSIPQSRIFDFVLLEDLAMIDRRHIGGLGGSAGSCDDFRPSTSPVLTGTPRARSETKDKTHRAPIIGPPSTARPSLHPLAGIPLRCSSNHSYQECGHYTDKEQEDLYHILVHLHLDSRGHLHVGA